jgi:hypothetical protein
MKIPTIYTLLLLFVSVWFPNASFGNQRLDVAMEGPWILYLQTNFPTAKGPSTVLVAVAPKVDHHERPVFSAGDGAQFDPGMFCVVFDKVCIPKPTNSTSLTHDTYPDPNPIPLSKHAWDWKKYASSAYILILPLPTYYSADGKESLTFQDALPTSTSPNAPSSPAASYAIGVQLHYLDGPDRIALYTCSNSSDASSCTTSAFPHDEENSGTLRITIRSDETSSNPDRCKYHVHGAYHSMLGLVDPQLSDNPHKRYIDVPKFDAGCTPGDPQQVPYPNTSMKIGYEGADANSNPINVPVELDMLVAYLKALDLANDGRQVALLELSGQANQFRGKFLRLSDLSDLRENLATSQEGLTQLLDELARNSITRSEKNRHALRPTDFKLRLEAALLRERALEREADVSMLSIFSGKDCRAAVMLVQ